MKKSDVAYHAVRRQILLARIKPGDVLLEQKIATELQCAQGTVREALMRLEQDGLVTRRGYRGTTVSQPSVEEAIEMAHIRIQIECLGMKRSAGSFDHKTIEHLYQIADQMDEAMETGDHYRASELDRQFHMDIFRRSDFMAMEPILNRCALHVHRFTFLNAEEEVPGRDIGSTHRKLIDIFQRRDQEASVAALGNHIKRVLRRFTSKLDSPGSASNRNI